MTDVDAAIAESTRLVRSYAREPGRSVLVCVRTDATTWTGGVGADDRYPAASLMKVPCALAVERLLGSGDLDPGCTVAVGDLLAAGEGPSALGVLRPDLRLTVGEVLGLTLALSDNGCAAWLFGLVGADPVHRVLAAIGCTATRLDPEARGPGHPLIADTTARDALRILSAAVDATQFPLTAAALAHNTRNSRIPLGAVDSDVRIAHKTGTLAGLAHDVAVIDGANGRIDLAFLSDGQHDTLATGYEMGICTRGLLQAWGISTRSTRSIW